MVRPQLYAQNAFRLTGLDVDTSLRDISRQAEKLEMMAKLGVNSQDRGAFAIAVTTEEVRAALQSIKIPEQRLLHEFFWFWPNTGDSKTDEALSRHQERRCPACGGDLDCCRSDPARVDIYRRPLRRPVFR